MPLISLSSIIEYTISCLFFISFFSTKGNAIQFFNFLEPILVIESSIVSERLNPLDEFELNNSRFFIVNLSIQT